MMAHLASEAGGQARARFRRFAAWLAAALLALGLLYAGVGLWRWAQPVSVSSGGTDSYRRWQQVRYMIRGWCPNVLYAAVEGHRDAYKRGDLAGDPAFPPLFDDLRLSFEPYPAGEYPPFSYGLMLPLHWPADRDAASAWFLALSLAGWAGTLIWAGRAGARAVPGAEADASGAGLLPPGVAGALAVGSVAAMVSFAATQAVGNYGSWCVGLCVAALLCLDRAGSRGRLTPIVASRRWGGAREWGWSAAAGTLLGLAMVKPTIAAPFFLVLLVRRAWWPGIAAGVGVVAMGQLAHYGLTGATPLASQAAAAEHLEYFSDQGGGIIEAQRAWFEVPEPYATYALAGLAMGVGWILLLLCPGRSLLARFAVCGLVARVGFYHRGYDNVLLVFLLVGLLVVALRATASGGWRAWVAWGAWLLAGATLWPPGRVVAGDTASLVAPVLWAALTAWLWWAPESREAWGASRKIDGPAGARAPAGQPA